MTGILAVNAFLHGKKYTELDDLLLAGAKAWGMQLQIKTNLGNINIELYDEQAPTSVKNFKSYV